MHRLVKKKIKNNHPTTNAQTCQGNNESIEEWLGLGRGKKNARPFQVRHFCIQITETSLLYLLH